jgi:excisionase family DNA binding protein
MCQFKYVSSFIDVSGRQSIGDEKEKRAMSRLITIAEFQKSYSVSRSTVYRLQKSGDITFVHVGRAVRIPLDNAENWCATLTSTASDA